jgi:NRPS condensation-like uncharacterized protein
MPHPAFLHRSTTITSTDAGQPRCGTLKRAVTQPSVIHDPALFTLDAGNIGAVVELRGSYDEATLVGAVDRLFRRFPILGCRYVHGFWRDRWEPMEGAPEACVRIADAADPDAAVREALGEILDPLAGPSLRLHLLRTERGGRLALVMTHMMVDGNGLLTTLRALGEALAGTGPAGPQPTNRSFFQLFRALRLRHYPRVLLEMLRDAGAFTGVMRASRWGEAFEAAAGDRVHAHRVVWTNEASRAFHAGCKLAGATVNDGLVANALGIVSRIAPGPRVAVAYTVNLRRFLRDDAPVVANLSGFLPVVAGRAIAEDPAAALAFANRRIGEHKQGFPGLGSNLLPLALLGALPHGLIRPSARVVRRWFHSQGRRAMVMTNVGPMDDYLAPFGNAARDAWVLPPTFPGFPAPISLVSTFGGRMSVCVGGPRTLQAEDVARVAAAWDGSVGGFAAAAGADVGAEASQAESVRADGFPAAASRVKA